LAAFGKKNPKNLLTVSLIHRLQKIGAVSAPASTGWGASYRLPTTDLIVTSARPLFSGTMKRIGVGFPVPTWKSTELVMLKASTISPAEL
jgi:hypothetical protein